MIKKNHMDCRHTRVIWYMCIYIRIYMYVSIYIYISIYKVPFGQKNREESSRTCTGVEWENKRSCRVAVVVVVSTTIFCFWSNSVLSAVRLFGLVKRWIISESNQKGKRSIFVDHTMSVLKENQSSSLSKSQDHPTEEDTICSRDAAETLSWRNLSVYAMDRGRRNICKQLINNGV